MTGPTVAALDRATKRYGSVEALRGLSLELCAGEIVALLGPNGAGKSTAIRLLLGLSSATAGTARVFGLDPRSTGKRTRIGAMLQVASVPRTLRVREHLDLFRSYYPAPLAQAELLRIARLGGLEERFFDQLSGGQKQRLLFALALAGDPEILFLDEPTVGMDAEARRGLWQQIRELAARGKTVLLTTHYLAEADALASRVVVLDGGEIVAEGTPGEIKSRCTFKTIRCETSLPEAQLRAMPEVLAVEREGSVTILRVSAAEAAVRRLLAADDHLSGLEIISPGLEDAFLTLLGRGPEH